MTNPAIADCNHPIRARTERLQDFLMLSSFGLWAVLLGLSPVLVFHLLMAG
jgi:hypothetical protein